MEALGKPPALIAGAGISIRRDLAYRLVKMSTIMLSRPARSLVAQKSRSHEASPVSLILNMVKVFHERNLKTGLCQDHSNSPLNNTKPISDLLKYASTKFMARPTVSIAWRSSCYKIYDECHNEKVVWFISNSGRTNEYNIVYDQAGNFEVDEASVGYHVKDHEGLVLEMLGGPYKSMKGSAVQWDAAA
ncbi:hypothetical protein VNO77_27461 [Canavalia gladiata]|uniref:Uncharacterized protein n=1 Tax=Canavalia gladiata TaxID=3824 RepID=A0AAN9Q6H5_CANGL